MAVVATILARSPVPASLIGQPLQPNNGASYDVKVVIQAADYSTGFATALVATACGLNALTSVSVISAQIAAGTTLLGFGVWDQPNAKVRFITAITNQTTATDYTAVNGDIFTLRVTGV